MKTVNSRRIPAIILTLSMMLSMILAFTVSGNAEAADNVYTLNVDDLKTFGAGTYDDGDYTKVGDADYFTAFFGSKAKLETKSKSETFDGGFISTKRISWGDRTTIGDQIINAIKIKTEGSATLKIWWVCGGLETGTDNVRQVAVFNPDGTICTQTTLTEADASKADNNEDGIKNDTFISTLNIPAAGVYYIGNIGGSNYFHKLEVTDNKDGAPAGDRAAWSNVASPVITSAEDNGEGNIVVNADALIGHDGADELLVHMYQGDELIATKGSITEKSSHVLTFTPENSGSYTFKAELLREGETAKASNDVSASFVYLLKAPYLSNVTSMGEGVIRVKWTAVHEAECYEVYCNGEKVATTRELYYIASGLTIDNEYTYKIRAVRGTEFTESDEMTTTATAEAKQEWSFVVSGPSTNEANNGYIGSVNDDGQVTIYSEGGKGKIQQKDCDGLALYYTAIPTEYNFTLRAKIHVDSWTYSNGQEGFGLIVTDRVGTHGDTSNFWTNSYLAGSTKIEYKYNPDTEQIVNVHSSDTTLKKFKMNIGIGIVEETGITKDNLEYFEANDSERIGQDLRFVNTTLDTLASQIKSEAGTYNVIGNYTSEPTGSFEERFLITDYIMEIQKNNTGYFISYYSIDGELLGQKKHYDPDVLSQIDEDYVYAGFFAARNARATFSDISLTTILASEDAPAEEPPIEKITPDITIGSADVANNNKYTLIIDPNVDGFLTVKYGPFTIANNLKLTTNERYKQAITLRNFDENEIKIEFTPDPEGWLPEYTELSSTKTIYKTLIVNYSRGNSHRKNIYVSPDVKPDTTVANGTKEFPYDIYTAVDIAYPGQTIILMEGTYKMSSALKIQRGIDGTEDNPIRMIADPEATTRPVLDFQGLYDGFTHGGDYWYFYGFDVTGSADKQKGFQISGNYNVLDQIHAYYNGNTGIQLSRYSGNDLYEDWPCHNLILNCTSYCNFDAGFEDADGFAAKLTIGDGNVFDGCIAYNNADDGWDLYAKVDTGIIGSVTIRNCVAYNNGFVPGHEKTGNGNGFKLGGSSIPGKHTIENCISFNNLAKGIDSNSCPDIIVKNCISFNNGSYNYAFYTNNVNNTAFVANNIISFRTENLGQGDQLSGKGDQIVSDYINESTYYWFNTQKSSNTNGTVITADMFVSLVFDGFERNADGTLSLKGFLEIKNNVPENLKNCKLGGQPSYDTSLKKDGECTFSEEWSNLDIYAHWHECECGFKTDIEYHNFEWIIDKEVVGMQTGLKHEECTICGFKRAAITTYPERPDEDDDPVVPDIQPDDGEIENGDEQPEEELSFFDKFIKAISDFFASIAAFFAGLFGGDKQ